MQQLNSFIQRNVSIAIEDAALIAAQFEVFEAVKGSLISRIGRVSDEYIFLEEGLIRCYLYDLEDNEVTTDFFTANGVAFDITSFFQRVPAETNMEAVTNCSGFKINYSQLNELFHARPSFREFGRAILVKEFISTKKRNYSMINQTAEQRYKALLAEKPEIIKLAPLKQVASYLGMTDSTLSRIRAKF